MSFCLLLQMADDDEHESTESLKAAVDEKADEADMKKPEMDAKKPETAEKAPEASSENVTYDESGAAIYTDPTTKYKYKWCKETSEWKAVENEHYTWCSDTQKWIPKATTENEFYRWCEKTSQWVPKMTSKKGEDVVYGYDEAQGVHTYTDKDGAVFFFDQDKKAWFPRVDDDFLAIYQLNYGFIDNTTKEPAKETADSSVAEDDTPVIEPDTTLLASGEDQPEGSNAKKRKAPAEPPKWFELPPEQNTKVYVSNLPLDITEEEFSELMGKCGMVMKDMKSGKFKLKLYRDPNGQLKGDGLCHYIKVSFVSLYICQFP